MKMRVPAEWSPQESVWMTWPGGGQWWKGFDREAESAFANLASAVSRFEKVRINCAPGRIGAVSKILRAASGCDFSNVEFFPNETNDVWCRDSGAVFRTGEGRLDALDFRYNAWGGKFPPWDLDDALAGKMAENAGVEPIRVPIVCEGGAIEFDGNGTLLTTESVVLNPNRNPSLCRSEAERIFAEYCGVEKTIWLPGGLYNDDTDGHIDNIARFAPGGRLIVSVCGEGNPSCGALSRNLSLLKNASGAGGGRFEIVELPLPEEPIFAKYYDGSNRLLPASYANYLVLNGAVLVPTYSMKSDERALGILKECFSGREVVGVDSRVFLMEGGAVHCLTQQQPAA